MEDRFIAQKTDSKTHMFGVFDGHGGDQVAEICREVLVKLYVEAARDTNVRGEALRIALSNLDAYAYQIMQTNALRSGIDSRDLESSNYMKVGSTACVVLVNSNGTLDVANIGDSRAIMIDSDGEAVIDLTNDHKPGTPSERERIQREGGFVLDVGGIDRVMGNLSVSRSIGDWYLRPWVSADPDINAKTYHANGKNNFVVIASDGVWDVMTSREVANILKTASSGAPLKPEMTKICRICRDRGSGDNITIVVVDLASSHL